VLGGERELLVLLGRGDGRFALSPQGVIHVGDTATGLAIGDVNGDGLSDVAVSHHDDFQIVVLLAGRDGYLRPAPSSPVTSFASGTPHSHNLVLADLNGDRRLDLIQAQSEVNAILVLLGDGTGRFAPAPDSPFPAGNHPYRILVADFDHDDKPDFAAPNARGGDLTVGLGDGRGGFRSPSGSRLPLGAFGLGLAAGDVNGDGHLDLVANFNDRNSLVQFMGDGKGSFRASSRELVARGRAYGQVIADLDLDGMDDVAAPSIDAGAVTVWLGRRGDVALPRLAFETPGTDSQVLAIADLNADGIPDAVTAGWERPTISVLLGQRPSAATRPSQPR
jgi:FG-GAP-like repeat